LKIRVKTAATLGIPGPEKLKNQRRDEVPLQHWLAPLNRVTNGALKSRRRRGAPQPLTLIPRRSTPADRKRPGFLLSMGAALTVKASESRKIVRHVRPMRRVIGPV
jgi:hypothetical protein